MSKIGEKLRILRQRKGLTSRELGEILGVSNSYIIRIENGKKRPSIDLVARMASFFQVTTEQLILDELKRFVQEGVMADELAETKANCIGRLPLSLESNGGVANALLNIERHQLGLDYYHRYQDLVNEVAAENILSTARKFIDPDKMVVATAGP